MKTEDTETEVTTDLATHAKRPSPAGERLRAAHEKWIAAGRPTPTLKEARALVKAYLDVDNEIEALDTLRAQLVSERNAAILAIVQACGKGRLDLGPKLGIQIPMARGDVLWFRPENSGAVRKVL